MSHGGMAVSFSDDMAGLASDVLFISIGECPLNNLSPKRLMSAFAGGRSVKEIVEQYHQPTPATSATLQVSMPFNYKS